MGKLIFSLLIHLFIQQKLFWELEMIPWSYVQGPHGQVNKFVLIFSTIYDI